MARVKNSVATRKRRKRILKLAKGYYGSKHRLFKTAKEQVMNSYYYAFRDRRQKKRDFRKLWIARINAAARMKSKSTVKCLLTSLLQTQLLSQLLLKKLKKHWLNNLKKLPFGSFFVYKI